MVLRTYTTGLSLQRIPLDYDQRRLARKELEEILRELSDENLAICQQYSEQTIDYLTDTAFLDHPISASIPTPERNSGKFGVNAIMQACGDSRNHIHSGFHLLQSAAKGVIDRIHKFQEILAWFTDHPDELVKWVFWGPIGAIVIVAIGVVTIVAARRG